MDNPFEIIFQQNVEIIKHLQDLKCSGLDIPSNVEPSSTQDQRFTADELAEYLGCARSTVLKYKRNKVIPFYQAGRTIIFKKSDIDSALSSMTPIKRLQKGGKAHD